MLTICIHIYVPFTIGVVLVILYLNWAWSNHCHWFVCWVNICKHLLSGKGHSFHMGHPLITCKKKKRDKKEQLGSLTTHVSMLYTSFHLLFIVYKQLWQSKSNNFFFFYLTITTLTLWGNTTVTISHPDKTHGLTEKSPSLYLSKEVNSACLIVSRNTGGHLHKQFPTVTPSSHSVISCDSYSIL